MVNIILDTILIIMEDKNMQTKSHIDKEKLANINIGQTFEYSAIASDDFPVSNHGEDGMVFKSEVESGIYNNIEIADTSAPHVKYRKISNEV